MRKIFSIFLLLAVSSMLIGCGNTTTTSQKNVKSNEKTLKEIDKTLKETKINKNEEVDYDKLRKRANVAEAASAVGYDGKAIKKELNKIINDREKMDKELQELGL